MTEAPQCVICDGEIRHVRRALVAPFLARRIWNRPPFCVDLVGCQSCGFMFYNPRLDDEEAVRLYSGYRSPEYQRMRQACEPWYTEAFNAGLASASSYVGRRRVLKDILNQHIKGRKIGRVLDYGGDHGDLVQGLIEGASAFVYDISGVPAVDGVVGTKDPASCQADLIINSNVLEHVSFPRRLVAELLEAAPRDGLIFIEAPCEEPLGVQRLARRIAQAGWVALARPALATSILRPASLYLMHEHINYYTEQVLAALMRSCGSSVLASGHYGQDGQSGKGVMGWCLGTAKSA